MILAIDTSTSIASIALVENERLLAELNWFSERNHTVELMPAIDYLFRLAGEKVESLKSIIVARGPGSFNGLRVGLSAAKGLAFSLNLPVIGVSSLETEAFVHADFDLPICPIFNAGRSEVATALFQKKGTAWTRLKEDRISNLAEISAETKEKTLFCGEISLETRNVLEAGLAGTACFVQKPANVRRAAFLAGLGIKYFKQGYCDNAAALQPIYLRRPPITQPKHSLWSVEKNAT